MIRWCRVPWWCAAPLLPEPVLRAFSRRRQDIEAFLQDSGLAGPRAAQLAAYATRAVKDPEAGQESLMGEWRQRADRLGLDPEALTGLVGQARVRALPGPRDPAAERVFAWLASPAVLTARSSTFGRREVLQALAAAVPRGAAVSEIVALGDAFLASDHVVLRASGGLRACDVIRRRDGTVIAAHVDEERWTTPEMLATERALIDSAPARRDAEIGIADHDEVVGALDRHPGLSDEQQAAVWRLTESGAGVEVMLGAAGTGKTAALAAAREAWTACGHRVIGGALAARTTAQLTEVTGIPSMTLHRLLSGLDDPERSGLTVRSVVVIDEAAMVGTRTLARILEHAERAEAKVVLVGDHHQLPEIDAGGRRVRRPRLPPRRERPDPEPPSTCSLGARGTPRAPDRAFVAYQTHGRIKHAAHGHDIREDLVDDWWTARAQGKQTIMVAGTKRNVDDLNDRARIKAHDAGRLGTEQLTIGGRDFAVGDEVIANRNDYRLGVLNGTRATITALDHENRAVRAQAEAGEIVVVPPAYLDAGHLSHGYAPTLHKAQGSRIKARPSMLRSSSPTRLSHASIPTRRSPGEPTTTRSTSRPRPTGASNNATHPNNKLMPSSAYGQLSAAPQRRGWLSTPCCPR